MYVCISRNLCIVQSKNHRFQKAQPLPLDSVTSILKANICEKLFENPTLTTGCCDCE